MNPINRAKLGAYLMVGIVSLMLFITGTQMPSVAMRVISSAPLGVTILFAAYDRWIWRWPGVVRLAGRPSLVGTWHGTLTSYRFGAESRQPVETTIDVALAITQTFTSTSVRLMTAQSASRSVTADFTKRAEEPDYYTLYYTYENTPRIEHRDQLIVHRGTTAATIHGPLPKQLEAEYWTNRDTKGSITAHRISNRRATTFQEACQLEARHGAEARRGL